MNRNQILCVEIFKHLHKIGPCCLGNAFKFKTQNYGLRNVNTLEIPKFNTKTYGQKSITYQGVKLWNSLSNDLRLLRTLKDFSTKCKTELTDACVCNCCVYCRTMV